MVLKSNMVFWIDYHFGRSLEGMSFPKTLREVGVIFPNYKYAYFKGIYINEIGIHYIQLKIYFIITYVNIYNKHY